MRFRYSQSAAVQGCAFSFRRAALLRATSGSNRRRHANGRNTQCDHALLSVQLPLPHLLPPGEYGVFISVGDPTGKPLYALPLAQGDGARRYKLGALRVAATR